MDNTPRYERGNAGSSPARGSNMRNLTTDESIFYCDIDALVFNDPGFDLETVYQILVDHKEMDEEDGYDWSMIDPEWLAYWHMHQMKRMQTD